MAEHLVKCTLPEAALSDLEQLAEWLLKVDYQPVGNIKLCSDQNLVRHSAQLLEHLPNNIKTLFSSDKHDTRMIAIHFDEPGSLVPVPEGMNVLLIPIAIEGGAKIGNEGLESLDYLFLNAEVPAEPDFYALLLICKK